jgi:hypothetical protein
LGMVGALCVYQSVTTRRCEQVRAYADDGLERIIVLVERNSRSFDCVIAPQ